MQEKESNFLHRIGSNIERIAAERPVFLAFLVFVAAAVLVIPISLPFYLGETREFMLNILAEAHGTVFDLLVIGWFLFWLNKLAERRQRNNRYREEIDDFLGWKSLEATHRIVGNIRRLNRSGVREKIRLTEAYLKGANLGGAFLKESDLWGADLAGGNLREANLARANLAGANLEGADMERVVLEHTDLRGCNLHEADLERSNISGADMRGVVLRVADLQYANLSGSNLERANLEGANLRGANLEGATLRKTNLQEANLSISNLRGANLIDAKLEHADLTGSDLRGTQLPESQEAIIHMFEKVKSLKGVLLDMYIENVLKKDLNHLFYSILDQEMDSHDEGEEEISPVPLPEVG